MRIARGVLSSICLLIATLNSVAFAQDTPDALLQRGLYLSDLYNWSAARPYLVKAKELFEANGDKRGALYAELALIRARGEGPSHPDLSFRLTQELATNPILQSDKELRMFCLVVKGELDGELGSTEMRRDWTEISTLAQQLGKVKWQYRALGQLGFADFYDGDLPGAQKKVAEALIGATNIKDVGGEIFYLSTTATGLVGQQMNEQAIQYADRAIALANATPDAGYPMIAEENRLIAMVNMGRITTAKAELKTPLARAEAENSDTEMGDLNEIAAMIARREHDIPSAAIGYISEALRHALIYGGRKAIPQFQSELSDLYRLSGNLPKAEALANEAATSVQTFGYLPLLPKFLQVVAEIQIAEHKYADAGHTYDRAAAIQDVLIGNANSELGKTALIRGASDLYAKHFALVAEHSGDIEKAFAILEQARGRVMADLLLSGAQTSPESIAAENKIAQLRLKLMTVHSDHEIKQLRDAIFMAEQSRSISPEISILKSKEHQAISLAKLQQNLSPSEAVLEYVIDDPASYCLVVTRRNSRIAKLASKRIIAPAVAGYLTEVKAKHTAHAEGRKLYELLLVPIPEARSKGQLIIIRDGPLHLVPLDGLLDAQNRYVVEFQSVVYAPSATSFFLLRTAARPYSATGVLAVGGVPYGHSGLRESAVTRGISDAGLPDLPSSSDEARVAIAAFPSTTSTLLVGEKATEAAFKRSINHRLIHLAVHGIANETRPDRAALVLLSDPQNGEDGFLEASEIVQLPLNADLVVLSACDTAVGQLEGEEGIETLSRAFLLAGARTVISTLWSIDDDTTLYLMKSFYSELAHNKPAPYALRNAKRKMLKTFGPTKALPYYWAGFTVEGLAQPPLGN